MRKRRGWDLKSISYNATITTLTEAAPEAQALVWL
jgi:hypothetical protein